KPYGLPQVVEPIWMTCTPTPCRLFMTASLAEQVPLVVSTKTLLRPRFGSACPLVTDRPRLVLWKPVGAMGSPVTGSVLACFALNCTSSNVWPAAAPGLAII